MHNYRYLEYESDFIDRHAEISAIAEILELHVYNDVQISPNSLRVLSRWLQESNTLLEKQFYVALGFIQLAEQYLDKEATNG